MVRNEKMGKIFPKKILGGFFRGVVYRGTCVWECWEIKEKIGEKKISGGQKFWGGTFGGNARKRGKLFWGSVGEL